MFNVIIFQTLWLIESISLIFQACCFLNDIKPGQGVGVVVVGKVEARSWMSSQVTHTEQPPEVWAWWTHSSYTIHQKNIWLGHSF